MALKTLNLGAFKRPPLPAPRVIPTPSAEATRLVREEVQAVDAEIAVTDEILGTTPALANAEPTPAGPTEENISDSDDKLNRLVDDEFPFDESQLSAVYGLVKEQFGCMIGAAGTGKTTVTKKLVDLLRDGLDYVDMSRYWMRGEPDEKDDYEIPERLIPSIVMVSFTGRASQMTKKNFPRDWHGNIMTIHRALGFYPEFYEDFDSESGNMVGKRRFVPSYDATNLMPWDIIVIDEAGMLGLDLWHQLYAACKPGCRIYMIGDINQLPPTHGKSVLGFAMSKWPVFELTHVHRQQGANNSIVDNAHRILKGMRPIGDNPIPLSIVPNTKGATAQEKMQPILDTASWLVNNKDWRVAVVDIPDQPAQAAAVIQTTMKLLHGRIYDPNRDVIITPTNGFEQTSPGYQLGQAPMNRELVVKLNQSAIRYLIDAGRERQQFAVGDKVMATVNDYEAGITNGMTGIIETICENGGYQGDSRRWGPLADVNEYLREIDEGLDDDDTEEFSLEEMVSDAELGMAQAKDKDKKDAGPASHIVTVRFGEGEHSFTINFDSKAKVASLMLAYAATCHKMQGGECPLIAVIVHNTHKRQLTREWYYTALTRASQRAILFVTRQGQGHALGKQSIKGTTVKQKIANFVALTQEGLIGASVRVKLPLAHSLVKDLTHAQPSYVEPEAPEPKPEAPRPVVINVRNLTINVTQAAKPTPVFDGGKDSDRGTVDGGRLQAETTKPLAIPQPIRYVSQVGAVLTLQTLRGLGDTKLIPKFDGLPANASTGFEIKLGELPPVDPKTMRHPPHPLISAIRVENAVPPPVVEKPKPKSFADLIAASKMKKP